MKAIRLIRFQPSVSPLRQHSWNIKVQAEGREGAPSEIFVYSRGKPGDSMGDIFQCVASLSQIEELATTAPTVIDEVTQIPFYRTAEATFVCRSAEEMEDIWSKIQQDTFDLLQNLSAAESLAATVAVEVTEGGIATVNLE